MATKKVSARKSNTTTVPITGKRMTLVELQQILGERINLTLKEDKTPEERQMDNEQSFLIMNIAKQMINNGSLILNIEKLAAQTKALTEISSYELINGQKI